MTENKKTIRASITNEAHAALRRDALRRGMRFSYMLAKIIEAYADNVRLDEMKKTDAKKGEKHDSRRIIASKI
mgnify:CR=1 FL=1